MIEKIKNNIGLLKEIFGKGYGFQYRWFRFRELIGIPSYAADSKENRKKFSKLFSTNKNIK